MKLEEYKKIIPPEHRGTAVGDVLLEAYNEIWNEAISQSIKSLPISEVAMSLNSIKESGFIQAVKQAKQNLKNLIK